MVQNNPITFIDVSGFAPGQLDYLDLAPAPAKEEVARVLRESNGAPGEGYRGFYPIAKKMIEAGKANSARLAAARGRKQVQLAAEFKRSGTMTTAVLKEGAAFSAIFNLTDKGYGDSFINLPGSLSSEGTFPGVQLITRNEELKIGRKPWSRFKPEKQERESISVIINSDSFQGKEGKVKWTPTADSNYRVFDENAFIMEIERLYNETGNPLHPIVKGQIINHIKDNNNILPKAAGIAGLHAEVRALNQAMNRAGVSMLRSFGSLMNITVMTKRLAGKIGADFEACYNCRAIIGDPVRILSGVTENSKKINRMHSMH
jgi:insecticidal toxin complex protein TccC